MYSSEYTVSHVVPTHAGIGLVSEQHMCRPNKSKDVDVLPFHVDVDANADVVTEM